ncbi:MAG TPA: methyltransferase domain-containing protein [Steroidobacteraceae bacterium]|nr:methyltransferase domain-containing protein [Steroidobacteraceae bacterium]
MRSSRLLPVFALCVAAPAITHAAAEAKADPAAAVAPAHDAALATAVNGAWRSDDAKSRDRYRHPAEALTFWGLRPGMTVLEIQPGAGWWTDILAPYAKATGGRYYATAADLANPKLSDGARKARTDFEQRLGAKPELYGKVEFVNWGDVSRTLPANTFDLILTARNVHGWMQDKPGTVEATFKEFHKALKPGGVLAIEQHRANPSAGAEQPASGYVTEQYVIEQAQKAGFKLAAKSEINANPKDTKDHPFGVWTLPPALRSTPYGSSQPPDTSFDHSKYLAIGESDRMTLKFVRN